MVNVLEIIGILFLLVLSVSITVGVTRRINRKYITPYFRLMIFFSWLFLITGNIINISSLFLSPSETNFFSLIGIGFSIIALGFSINQNVSSLIDVKIRNNALEEQQHINEKIIEKLNIIISMQRKELSKHMKGTLSE